MRSIMKIQNGYISGITFQESETKESPRIAK